MSSIPQDLWLHCMGTLIYARLLFEISATLSYPNWAKMAHFPIKRLLLINIPYISLLSGYSTLPSSKIFTICLVDLKIHSHSVLDPKLG